MPRIAKYNDPNSLVPEDKQKELRDKARTRVAEKLRKKEEERLLAQYEKEVEREMNEDPNEEIRHILIDLPGHSDNICLDGDIFYHGRSYEVRASVFDYLAAQIQACWRHEDEIGGANRGAYQKPQTQTPLHHLNANGLVQSRGLGGRF